MTLTEISYHEVISEFSDMVKTETLPPKGAENQISLEIRLGAAQFLDKGISWEDFDDLRDFIGMRYLIQQSGTEHYVDISKNGALAALKDYQARREVRKDREFMVTQEQIKLPNNRKLLPLLGTLGFAEAIESLKSSLKR